MSKKRKTRASAPEKRTLRALLRDWDEDRVDLTAALERKPAGRDEAGRPHRPLRPKNLQRLEYSEISSFRRLYPVLAVMLCTVIIGTMLLIVGNLPLHSSADVPTVNEVTERYLEQGMAETGAVNAVAGIILDYRAFDTLGESFVLFTAVSAVLILMLDPPGTVTPNDDETFSLQDDVPLRFAVRILAPILVIFGIYVILGGHLGPGGGFSGGAIIGAGLILLQVSYGPARVGRVMNMKVFRTVTLCALCFYATSKCYSFFTGANGLHSFISNGTPGRILSAGLILPLNIAVGIVVSCTMYGFYSVFKRGRI